MASRSAAAGAAVHSGYLEIREPTERYGIIYRSLVLSRLCGFDDISGNFKKRIESGSKQDRTKMRRHETVVGPSRSRSASSK